MLKEDEFKVKASNRGLPGKSFIYIVTIDYYLKMAMSYLSNTPFLDAYVSSFIKWHLIYNSRKKMMNDFFNYMLVYDETRIEYLIPSKFFKRSNIFEILNKLNFSIKKYEEILEKEEKTNKDLKYMFKFEMKFGKDTFCMRNSLKDLFNKIIDIQEIIISFYLNFIISNLMKKRMGGKNPLELKYEAYQTMLGMIDSYDSSRSKVPFHNFLKFFIKAEKHKMIREDNWGLPNGDIIPYDDKYSNELLEESIDYETIKNDQEFIDALSEYLPKSIFNILTLKFGILNPLKPHEEIRLLL